MQGYSLFLLKDYNSPLFSKSKTQCTNFARGFFFLGSATGCVSSSKKNSIDDRLCLAGQFFRELEMGKTVKTLPFWSHLSSLWNLHCISVRIQSINQLNLAKMLSTLLVVCFIRLSKILTSFSSFFFSFFRIMKWDRILTLSEYLVITNTRGVQW